MPKINEKKLDLYTNKLYQGELKRYKKKKQRDSIYSINSFYRDEGKIKRRPVSRSQEKTVLDTHKNKCVICNKPYDKDDFEIHHVDGDRSNSVTKNLVPLCHRCHKKMTTNAKAKLRDYQVKQGRNEPANPYGFTGIKPVKIRMPKPPKWH